MATKRCAVVTGANKGIGLEICKQLASNGIVIVLTARDEKRGVEAVENLKSQGFSDVIFHQLNVMSEDSVVSLATFIKSHFEKLDILVNNVGISGVIVDWEAFKDLEKTNKVELGKKLTKQNYAMAQECVKTNYYGTKRVTEALLPFLVLSDSGRIVNVSASMGKLQSIPGESIRKELNDIDSLTKERIDEMVNGFLNDFENEALESKGWPLYLSAYIVSKAAVNAYTRILAKEYPSLCANCVCPGFVKTDMNSNMGIHSVEDGAKGPVMLALLAKAGPSGLFYKEMQVSTF